MSTPHVLIAGAGPVGLVSALVLSKAGVRVTVFERSADLAEDLRASTWHPPTLDLLDAVDPTLSKALIEMGLIARYTQYRDRSAGLIAEFDMELLRCDTAHPYRVQCEQFKFTRLVRDRLSTFPSCKLVFDAQVTAVSQGIDSVALSVNALHGPQSYQGDYLIGADGAYSAVRQAAGIEFEGFTYPERFYVASTDFDFSQAFDRLSYVNYISDPNEWCVLLRVPNLWRVLFPTRPEETDEEVVADAPTEARLQGVVSKEGKYQTAHRTLYRVHQKVAKTYSCGRIFLAGDAAHINNPLGGMGMNGGLHDGLNLSHKLVSVLLGDAPPESLDAYERERRPIAIESINANTARNKKMMEERDPAARRRNQDEMRRIADDPASARAFLLKSSMIESLRTASDAPPT